MRFLVGIDHEEHIRQTRHVFDARQVLVQVLALALQADDFLLRTAGVAAFDRGHGFQFLQPLDGLLHREHVGEQSAQPALVDVVHLAAVGLFGDGFLRLPLGADEEHILALRGHLADEPGGVFEHLQGLLKIDDVNSVTFAEDVFLHLRIPALGLVPEVNAGFEQFLHGYCGQTTS